MLLTKNEKKLISEMEQDDILEFADYDRSNYQYEVELPRKNEYRVSKYAIMCLAVEYFKTPDEVIIYIEN